MYDWHIYAVVASAVLLDIVSGIMQATINHSLSSEKLRLGAYHKTGYLIVIALACLLEYGTTYLDLGFSAPVVTPVCVYLVITEAVSIFENVTKINPELKNSPIFNLLGKNQNRRSGDK